DRSYSSRVRSFNATGQHGGSSVRIDRGLPSRTNSCAASCNRRSVIPRKPRQVFAAPSHRGVSTTPKFGPPYSLLQSGENWLRDLPENVFSVNCGSVPLQARMPTFQPYPVIPILPAALEPLREMSFNLWWTWEPAARRLFRHLDHELWNRTNHNPVRMLQLSRQSRLEELAQDKTFLRELKEVFEE